MRSTRNGNVDRLLATGDDKIASERNKNNHLVRMASNVQIKLSLVLKCYVKGMVSWLQARVTLTQSP